MAAGDGFKQVPFGFDKNEVNTYISDLRKKMSALEADMRANDEKTRAAEKLADEADSRIKAAVEEGNKKAEELNAQLEEEKSTTSRQIIEIRNLKERLDNEKKKMTDMLKSGKGVSAEAKRTFNEIVDKANEEAAEIIEKAEQQAADIVAAAKQQSAEITEKANAFLQQLREQLEAMNTGYNALNQSASELLGTEPAAAVTLPEPAATIKPAPEKPAAEEAAPAEIEIEAPVVEETIEEPAAEVTEPEPQPEPDIEEPVEEPQPVDEIDETPADFDEVWSGSEMANAVAEAEKKMAAQDKKDIPLVNPDASSNPFDGDLFSMDDNGEDMTDFDMDKQEGPDLTVDNIEPLDVSDHAQASYDKDFSADLLAQTLPSSALGDDTDADLLAAVKAAEEAASVKPNDVADIDMDEEPASSGDSEEDELMKALREAEAALNSMKDQDEESEPEQEEEPAASDDPWADLQKQLEAMESANGAGSAVTYDEPEPVQDDEPAAPPSADDSSIWNFGGESSDDEDMSSDFGGFSGF